MKENKNTEDSEVQAFYSNSTIFITGATGFIGMVLIEKLLRSCPDIKKIYLLMREKKGKTMNQRFEELLTDPLFELMKEKCLKYEEKLSPVYGDCSLPNLGLSEDDIKLLQTEVNVVFHNAATIRFDEPLKRSVAINIQAIRDLLRIARHMQNLQAVLHLSTAFANCPSKEIEEYIYEPPMDYERLLNLVNTLDDSLLEQITPKLIKPWPNTYVFTKAIGEDVVRQEGKDLPICILRPSMVINTVKEPIPGWTNNVNGPIGGVFGAAIGILHTIYMKKNNNADMVPVDMLINSMIVAAWKEGVKRSIHTNSSREPVDLIDENHVSKDMGEGEVPVYNYVSSARNPITWKELVTYNLSFDYPSEHCVWYYSVIYTELLWLSWILRIFLHYLPALLVDTACIFLWRKPIMLRAYKKIHRFLDLTVYFQKGTWTFSDQNVQRLWTDLKGKDQVIFPFDIRTIDWKTAMASMLPGLRVYFLKDPLHTVEKAKKKYFRLKVLHYTVMSAMILLLLKLLWWIISVFL